MCNSNCDRISARGESASEKIDSYEAKFDAIVQNLLMQIRNETFNANAKYFNSSIIRNLSDVILLT